MLERVELLYSILLNLAGLMFCLFQYVRKPRKLLAYAVVFLLTELLSNYYWGVYVLIMGDSPNVSSLLAYFGWDASFLVLVVMLIILMQEEKIRFFSPLALLPVPINLIQFMLYLPFGGLLNNIWQCSFTTVAAVLSLNLIIYYFRNRKKGALPPYISFVCLGFITLEYLMWTVSCYDWPSVWQDPYPYISMLALTVYILLPWAIIKHYSYKDNTKTSEVTERIWKVIMPVYAGAVSILCIVGYALAGWMKKTLTAGIGQVGDTDPYSVIAVMLFGVSCVIVAFSVIIILLVNFEQKSAESERFRQAKALAEQSNAAKSDFLANMSHEIRTPINAVLGMNEMILRESLSARDDLPGDKEEARRIFSDICNYSGNIHNAGTNLLSIINDILDFSKIEAGKLELVSAEYSLSSVLNDVSNMIIFKARSKDLEFTVDVMENIPDRLFGDEVRVRQIITNILNNAVKYTHKGSVKLTVKERELSVDQESIDLVFSVKDTGIGIKKEDQARLFKKFERVDLEKNSTVEGTGLGLVITMSLLDMMGGSIAVESVYSEGSTFTILIPQKIINREPIGDFRKRFESSINSLKPRKEAFHAPRAHILVVDDTQMNLIVVKGLLKSTLINIDTAPSGAEAIVKARQNTYDIILMDQRMPEMDGVTAMRRIKEDSESLNPKTPFICLTADAIAGAREKYIAEGFEDYLTKPVDGDRLEAMVLKYLPKEKLGGNEARRLIDRETGLFYSGDSEELYLEILKEYVMDSEHKLSEIKKYYDEKDWQNYSITVHALKSSSKSIGASELADIALHLELASKAGDEAAIVNSHDSLLKLYGAVVDEARRDIDK